MNTNIDQPPLYQKDLEQTRASRARLRQSTNLMYWYQELYRELFTSDPDISRKRVLEIGSGASPLKIFLSSVVTSDVLQLEYLDVVFDCHEIAQTDAIPDHSVDIITLTNVLHHLRDPLQFLRGAKKKLAPGGQIVLVEPYFSWVSYPLYKALHHEPVNFDIQRPLLDAIQGPLSTSNQAIPYMIFFSRPNWRAELDDCYDIEKAEYAFFTSLAYMVTGGISRTFPVPARLYRWYFKLDRWLARRWPRVFASFFSVRLTVKGVS
jgi:SAM-dependent methyltransferase